MDSLTKIRQLVAKDRLLEVVEKWQAFWMDQRQNSKEDYENYWRRAFGVDANMRHNMARMLSEDLQPAFEALCRVADAAVAFRDIAEEYRCTSGYDTDREMTMIHKRNDLNEAFAALGDLCKT